MEIERKTVMKTIIICASMHHGNTRKVADAIAAECGAEVLDALTVKERDLSEYDLIGFASGIYGGRFHPALMEFAKKNLPQDKKIFYIMTSAMDKDFSRSMESAVSGKNAEVAGRFSCKGYNTFGPFKLIGGTAKGHPDEDDLKNAAAFYQEMVSRL